MMSVNSFASVFRNELQIDIDFSPKDINLMFPLLFKTREFINMFHFAHLSSVNIIGQYYYGKITLKSMMVKKDFLTYPAVPDNDQAVPNIFPSGTIRSPKNSITMMLIRHCNRCLYFHVQSQRFLRVLWLCKVTARWPDPVSSMTHISVHSLVNGVRSTWTSFLVCVIGSTPTVVRKVSEVTKEMKLHDYD